MITIITQHNLIRHEIIGLKTKIVEAKNPLNLKLSGKIIDETHHTFVIESKGKEKRVFKTNITLDITLPDKKHAVIDGAEFEGRPWDRVKKKVKRW